MIYCISDIHGQYGLYMKMLEKIKLEQNDTMFVIGDVIDRGYHGIRILRDIMDRDNMVFMLGNHEYMMYKVIVNSRRGEMLSNGQNMDYYLWEMNGGATTYNEFHKLDEETQSSVIQFLENAYVVVPQLKVNDRCYMLAHSTHPSGYFDKPVVMKDLPEKELERIIWDREYLGTSVRDNLPGRLRLNKQYDNDTTLIIGHTPTPHVDRNGFLERGYGVIFHSYNNRVIDIDCGCAIQNSDMRCLGCLCLDTLEEFYVRG